MLVFILIPLLLAMLKGYKVSHVLRVLDLYPFFAVCALHGFFVVCAWLGNHSFVVFASALQYFLILSLLLPVMRRRLFVPSVVGLGLTLVGTAMNRVVIRANGGKMPVKPTVSEWIGYYKPGQLDGAIDDLHILLDDSAKLPFLADYIDLGVCILSPGDVLIHVFASIVVYYTVKAVCPRASREAFRETEEKR